MRRLLGQPIPQNAAKCECFRERGRSPFFVAKAGPWRCRQATFRQLRLFADVGVFLAEETQHGLRDRVGKSAKVKEKL